MADNGRDGLAKVKSQKPDLILLDIMMPEMNGLEVLERLKGDPDTKEIIVIVLTNLAGKQDAKLALDKGALKYIVKSEQDPKEVVEMVKSVLVDKSQYSLVINLESYFLLNNVVGGTDSSS